MKKIISFLFIFVCGTAFADGTLTIPRVSLFSTTVDWAAVTGLQLSQYTGNFIGAPRSLLKKGLVLYYLDGFPCYGEADSVRVWLSPNGDAEGNLRLVCVATPSEIKFAYRNAAQDAGQRETTGILVCPVDGDYNLKIDLSKCTKGPDWQNYNKK